MKNPLADPPRPCGFCKDPGTHALMIFSNPAGDTAVCSDCIKIFYKRVKSVEQDYEPKSSIERH